MDNRTIEQIRDNETKLIKELQQKENIIKEIRECVEIAISEDDYDGKIFEIKEILNKVDEENK